MKKSEENPKLPVCGECGNDKLFEAVELRKTEGVFKVGDDGEIVFSPNHDTADLEGDGFYCAKCDNRIHEAEYYCWEE